MTRGRTKSLEAKARALRLKEKRIARQAGMLVHGNRIIDEAKSQGFEEGRRQGFLDGLKAAQELGREHRRMTWFMRELRALIEKAEG